MREIPNMAFDGLRAELTVGQLLWWRAAKQDNKDRTGQEYAHDEAACFLGSGNCPFDAIAIERVLADSTPVLERRGGSGETENGYIRWLDYDPEHWYVLFFDPAGALGTSRLAFVLIDGVTGEEAAEWCGRCDPTTAGNMVMDCVRIFQRTVIAIELNMGAISATMISTMCGAPHMLTSDPQAWPRLFRSYDSGGQMRVGWETTPKNRPQMLNDFGDVWQKSPQLFHSPRLANEVKSSIRKGDRIQEGKGMTNDIVMAAAGAHAVRPLVSVVPPEPHIQVLTLHKGRSALAATGGSDRGWQRIT